jgi:hypothetical protein
MTTTTSLASSGERSTSVSVTSYLACKAVTAAESYVARHAASSVTGWRTIDVGSWLLPFALATSSAAPQRAPILSRRQTNSSNAPSTGSASESAGGRLSERQRRNERRRPPSSSAPTSDLPQPSTGPTTQRWSRHEPCCRRPDERTPRADESHAPRNDACPGPGCRRQGLGRIRYLTGRCLRPTTNAEWIHSGWPISSTDSSLDVSSSHNARWDRLARLAPRQ